MKCTHCQAENREEASFCEQCGKPLVLKCPNCNSELRPTARFCDKCGYSLIEQAPTPAKPPSIEPTSFANGRYQVKKFLGEGGKKKVYLAHDTDIDRDIAFYLIKTEKLDESTRTRIKREAQAMGRLGDHPNIMSIFDFGDHEGQPYMVAPLMAGGDVEKLIEKAPDHKMPLDKVVEIAKSVCKGLEFAHARGVIHRDIKPGNIWMSADSTVKIGDFGLSVAVDLSRLTQEGMMVGTVSYMPPEQAMGGKVTAKADLYSLGAMLYEMVTGRPPFVGDDSVAIIGQHINTSPVSPSWHRVDLPPALETLIMQLLEKDPEKRPESATIVLQALESITAGKVKEESVQKAAPSENPLYRRVFVGRERELKQLQSNFDGAISGQGALMMVVGEPGIGKTAICEQLATYVTLRGGKTLVGHCYEEGSLSLPYLAFVEAMRSYVLDREVEDLRKELGTGAADIARIVSEVRDKLHIELMPSQNPDEERYRLMQAVTGFLVNAASLKPMLVILEDLHDADKGTLDMLTHVSRNIAKSRLLLVGTYRDVEVDRNHPLSAALADLRRISTYRRVLLRGLNADEVRRMLSSITGEEAPWGLAEAVHRQTEGNPLFVQEVLRYLAEEGLITQEAGRWRTSGRTALEMSIPEGLRDVIGKRLSSLSEECNQLLSVAAVIGREFSLDVLRGVVKIDEDTFVRALKETVQMSVLEERSQVGSIRYRFAHAFFRQTLYEEMVAPLRLTLHQQVARTLEKQYARRLEEHATELAEHFSQSTDPADLKKAVSYGEMAAQRAIAVYAFGEAVRLLEQTIKVQKVLDPDDREKQCDLLLALGDALIIAGEPERAMDIVLTEACSLAEAIGDNARASRACSLATTGLLSYAATNIEVWNSPAAGRWVDKANRYAEPDTPGRAWADFVLGGRKATEGWIAGDYALMEEGFKLFNGSIELARRLDDPATFWHIAYLYLLNKRRPQDTDERWHAAEEMAQWPRNRIEIKALGIGLAFIGNTFLESDQREHAEEFYKELKDLAERSGQGNLVLISIIIDAIMAMLDGRLEEAEETNRYIMTRGEELGLAQYATACVNWTGPICQILLGRADESPELYPVVNYPLRALYLAHTGQDAEATEILNQHVLKRPGLGTPQDLIGANADIMYLEAALLVGHKEVVERLRQRFINTNVGFITIPLWTCPQRILGAADVFLENYEEAREYYKESLKLATEIRSRPEIALTRLQLAELLLDHYPNEKKEALKYLDFAIKEFREMKMRPSLERALRRKDILKA